MICKKASHTPQKGQINQKKKFKGDTAFIYFSCLIPHNRSKHLTMKMKKLSFLLFLTLQMGMAQAQEKLVALSFDDGPNTTTTVHMLDVLKKHQVKASFFVIG